MSIPLPIAEPAPKVVYCSGRGQFHSPNNPKKPQDYQSISMAEIRAMLEDPPSVPKSAARWVIFSSVLSRVHAEQRERGAFHALWADIDDADGISFDRLTFETAGLGCGTFFAYTTKSATPENHKARVIVPLADPVPGRQYAIYQKILNDKLEALGIKPDRKNEAVGQICFLPNRGKLYLSEIQEGGGLMDPGQWTADLDAEKEREAERETEIQGRREASRVKALERVKSGELSPIDAYREHFDIETALEVYGYKLAGRGRWLSPNSGGRSAGVTISTDGKKWISAHGSDAGLGIKTANGTMGDAFDLFVYYEHHGDRDAAVRAAAAMFLAPPVRQSPPQEKRPAPGPPPVGLVSPPRKETGTEKTMEGLMSFSVVEKYVEGLGAEAWLYPNLIIKNQITTIIAFAGGGKTTVFFNHVCPYILEKNPETRVFYLDMDSPASDHKKMFERAKACGDRFRWINPTSHGKDERIILKFLSDFVSNQSDLSSCIFVFDTLKKFINLMDKNQVKPFYKLLRKLSSLGATDILLGHGNKYRDSNGNIIPEGVGDIKNDSDALIVFERIPINGGMYVSTVVDPDKNAKVRGVYDPLSFFIEMPSRDVSICESYYPPVDMSGAAAPRKISDDQIMSRIRNFLSGQHRHVSRQEIIDAMRETGLTYNRVHGLLKTIAVHEKDVSGPGQIFFSWGEKHAKNYAISE